MWLTMGLNNQRPDGSEYGFFKRQTSWCTVDEVWAEEAEDGSGRYEFEYSENGLYARPADWFAIAWKANGKLVIRPKGCGARLNREHIVASVTHFFDHVARDRPGSGP